MNTWIVGFLLCYLSICYYLLVIYDLLNDAVIYQTV
jgi:hypothetical protein